MGTSWWLTELQAVNSSKVLKMMGHFMRRVIRLLRYTETEVSTVAGPHKRYNPGQPRIAALGETGWSPECATGGVKTQLSSSLDLQEGVPKTKEIRRTRG
jgi:hypothetical protein